MSNAIDIKTIIEQVKKNTEDIRKLYGGYSLITDNMWNVMGTTQEMLSALDLVKAGIDELKKIRNIFEEMIEKTR